VRTKKKRSYGRDCFDTTVVTDTFTTNRGTAKPDFTYQSTLFRTVTTAPKPFRATLDTKMQSVGGFNTNAGKELKKSAVERGRWTSDEDIDFQHAVEPSMLARTICDEVWTQFSVPPKDDDDCDSHADPGVPPRTDSTPASQ
jgi:hypothetical protein